MKFKSGFLLLVIFLITSCSSTKSPESLSALPSWYVNPKQNDSINLYGVGEGFTVEEASRAALKNLAAKLLVNISSESSMLLESTRTSVSEQSSQQINEVVEKIDFSDYKVSNSAQKGSKIYAEIMVNRNNFITEQRSKIDNLSAQMIKKYDSANNKSILEKRNILAEILPQAKEYELATRLLFGLEVPGINLKDNLSKADFYRQSYASIINKIEFFLETEDQDSIKIARAIQVGLNHERMKISKNKDENNANLVIIKIKSDTLNNNIYGAFIAKVKIDLELASSKNKTIASNHLEVTGNSRISAAEANNAAIVAFSNQIKDDGILKILAIEKSQDAHE